jgi:hypothetical protein
MTQQEGTMRDQEKLQAVEDYLQTEFPDAKIEIKWEPRERIHRCHILHQGKPHCVIIVEAFLQGFAAALIPAALQDFTVAEHLREMGMTPLVVTPEGLKLEGD